MTIRFVGATVQNPVLEISPKQRVSDTGAIWKGKSTFQENLCEYAARVCYRSIDRMGSADNFLPKIVDMSHLDVIEHVHVAVKGQSPLGAPWRLEDVSKYFNFTVDMRNAWTLSASLRVWLEFFRAGKIMGALPVLKAVAPKVFEEFECDEEVDVDLNAISVSGDNTLKSRKVGQARVTLLGFMAPTVDPVRVHGQAVFLVEGVSRAMTHQLVRHRLGSYSQESQRYVRLEKGGWKPVIPPAIMENPEALALMDFTWETLEETYKEFRKMGIRKEDARFVLPNAAETRIVVSMGFKGWQHFCWLRAVDKAAQWEIREVGQAILEMLYAIAPDVFKDEWDAYQNMS